MSPLIVRHMSTVSWIFWGDIALVYETWGSLSILPFSQVIRLPGIRCWIYSVSCLFNHDPETLVEDLLGHHPYQIGCWQGGDYNTGSTFMVPWVLCVVVHTPATHIHTLDHICSEGLRGGPQPSVLRHALSSRCWVCGRVSDSFRGLPSVFSDAKMRTLDNFFGIKFSQ